jgi:hypothetical protein
VFRRIFRPESEEVMGGWRRLHIEQLCNLYASPNIIKVIKSIRIGCAACVASVEVIRNAANILVGKPEGKRPLGRPMLRWEDNTRMDLREMWECVD